MGDAVHPEDRKNDVLLCAARRGDDVDMTWPDDLALARYLWRKVGTAIVEYEFMGSVRVQEQKVILLVDDDYLAAEIEETRVVFQIPRDVRAAKYLHAKLGDALDDKEWALYRQARGLQAQLVKDAQQRVSLGDARDLKKFRGRVN